MGVLLHNENKLDEMTHVLDHYMQLVPKVEANGFLLFRNGSTIPFDDTRFNTKLLGGDQLTVVRVRSTQALRDTLDDATQRYDGIVPVVEDWHARTILLQVSAIAKMQCTCTDCNLVGYFWLYNTNLLLNQGHCTT